MARDTYTTKFTTEGLKDTLRDIEAIAKSVDKLKASWAQPSKSNFYAGYTSASASQSQSFDIKSSFITIENATIKINDKDFSDPIVKALEKGFKELVNISKKESSPLGQISRGFFEGIGLGPSLTYTDRMTNRFLDRSPIGQALENPISTSRELVKTLKTAFDKPTDPKAFRDALAKVTTQYGNLQKAQGLGDKFQSLNNFAGALSKITPGGLIEIAKKAISEPNLGKLARSGKGADQDAISAAIRQALLEIRFVQDGFAQIGRDAKTGSVLLKKVNGELAVLGTVGKDSIISYAFPLGKTQLANKLTGDPNSQEYKLTTAINGETDARKSSTDPTKALALAKEFANQNKVIFSEIANGIVSSDTYAADGKGGKRSDIYSKYGFSKTGGLEPDLPKNYQSAVLKDGIASKPDLSKLSKYADFFQNIQKQLDNTDAILSQVNSKEKAQGVLDNIEALINDSIKAGATEILQGLNEFKQKLEEKRDSLDPIASFKAKNNELKGEQGLGKKFQDAIAKGDNKLAQELGDRIIKTTDEAYALFERIPQAQRDKSIKGIKGSLESRRSATVFDLAGIPPTVGKNIEAGFKLGADGKSQGEQFARDVIDGAEDELEIKSPSKVFQRIGRFVVEGFKSGIGNAKNMPDAFENWVQKIEAQFGKLPKVVKDGFKFLQPLLAGFLVGQGIQTAIGWIKQLRDAASEVTLRFEQMEKAFAFSTSENAVKGLSNLRQQSQRRGVDFETALGAQTSLNFATKGTALEGRVTDDIFNAIADTSAVRGFDKDQQKALFDTFSQLSDRSVITFKELAATINTLPGGLQIAARALGVTDVQLKKMAESGEIVTTDFLPKFIAQLNSENAGGLVGASNTAQASVARFNNSWTEFLNLFGKAKQPIETAGFNAASAAIDTLNASIGAILKTASLFGVANAFVSLNLIGRLTGLVVGLYQSIFTATAAMGGATVATGLWQRSLTVLGATIRGVGAFFGSFFGTLLKQLALAYIATETWTKVFETLDESGNEFASLTNEIQKGLDKIDASFDKNAEKSLDWRDTIIGAVNAASNAYFKALSGDQSGNYNVLTTGEELRQTIFEGKRNQAVDQSVRFSNDAQAIPQLLKQQQELETQLNLERQKRTQILPGDAKGLEESVAREKALLDKYNNVSKDISTRRTNLEQSIAALKQLQQNATDDVSKKLLQSAINDLEKTQGAMSKLLAETATGLAGVTKTVNDLQGSIEALNRGIDAKKTDASIAIANDGLGVNNSKYAGVGNSSKNQAIARTATRLGVTTEELAAIIAQESSFNPSIKGGDGGNYHGLFQWGASERANELPRIFPKIGVNANADITKVAFEKQLEAFELWAKGRGFKAGMGNQRLYATILGGNPYATSADSNGTVANNNPSINRGGSNYRAGLRFLGQSVGQQSTATITQSQEEANLNLDQQKSAEYQKRIAEARKKIDSFPFATYSLLFLGINPDDVGQDLTTKKGNPIWDGLIKSVEDYRKILIESKNVQNTVVQAQLKQRDTIVQNAESLIKQANEGDLQKAQNLLKIGLATYDQALARTQDPITRQYIESSKEGFQNSRQFAIDRTANQQRYDLAKNALPVPGIDKAEELRQIQAEGIAIKTNYELTEKIRVAKLEQLKIDNNITLANERRQQLQELAVQSQKLESDKQLRDFDNKIRDAKTPYNPEQVANERKYLEETIRLKAEELRLTQVIANAEEKLKQNKLKGLTTGIDEQKNIDSLKKQLGFLSEQAKDAQVNLEIGTKNTAVNNLIKQLQNSATLTNLQGEITNEQANKAQRQGADIFGLNAIRLAAEKLKIQAETNVKVAEYNRLIADNTALGAAGYESKEQVIALRDATIQLSELKLDGLKDQFKDLGGAIADNADKAFGEFFNNIFDGTKGIGDAFNSMAQSILKSLAKIASDGLFSNLKNLLGLGGSPVAGFGSLLGGGISPIQSLFNSNAAAAPVGLFGPAFADGGYTGDGGKWDRAGIVHAGEMVFSQRNISDIGLNYLSNLRSTGKPKMPDLRSYAMGNGYRGNEQPSRNVSVINNYNIPNTDSLRKTSNQLAIEQAEANRRAMKYQ